VSAERYARLGARVLVGFAAAGATTLVLLGQAGRTHHTLDQLNALLAPLLVLLALLLAAALRLRDRAVIALAAVGLAVGGFQLGGAALQGWRDRAAASGPTVKIMTLSAYHANPAPGTIRAAVAAQNPDIVVLQESNGNAASVIAALLPGFQRIGSCKRPSCTQTMISRWPLRRMKVHYVGHAAQPDLLVADVDAPFGRFRVASVHLPRPYEKHAKAFTRTLAAVARANASVPLVMLGDFNTASGSFGLAQFARDSRLRRRDGFIPTYPANQIIPAFAGIDHVFTDARWAGAGCRRTAAGHSDHYGVACRLVLRKTD
jgi:endonuclease/exonuclease/phosphatase family metal-dependent hydrolase